MSLPLCQDLKMESLPPWQTQVFLHKSNNIGWGGVGGCKGEGVGGWAAWRNSNGRGKEWSGAKESLSERKESVGI